MHLPILASAGIAYYLYKKVISMSNVPLELIPPIHFAKMNKKQLQGWVATINQKYREAASTIAILQSEVRALNERVNKPLDCLLWCPSCNTRHIDEGEFATKPHHTHACQECGMVWRPAIQATVGVQFLPGFKNKT